MTNEELNKILIKADMEYDKLKDTVAEQSFEIERLNNIINELEKWLEERSEYTNFGSILDKIKELKGSE